MLCSVTKESKCHENQSRSLTGTAKNHIMVILSKREGNKKGLYIRRSAFVLSTLIPNFTTIGKGKWSKSWDAERSSKNKDLALLCKLRERLWEILNFLFSFGKCRKSSHLEAACSKRWIPRLGYFSEADLKREWAVEERLTAHLSITL